MLMPFVIFEMRTMDVKIEPAPAGACACGAVDSAEFDAIERGLCCNGDGGTACSEEP